MAQLNQRAQAIAAYLQSFCEPGDRALLLYPSGLEFIAAFFACLYAGVVAVPVYPPRRHQKLSWENSDIRQHLGCYLTLIPIPLI